jgi:hypothetical protein
MWDLGGGALGVALTPAPPELARHALEHPPGHAIAAAGEAEPRVSPPHGTLGDCRSRAGP